MCISDRYIKGPDFPTGGIILGNSGIKKAYETGRGSITTVSYTHLLYILQCLD